MRENWKNSKGYFFCLGFLVFQGKLLAMGLPFPSPPLVVEAKGMGNAAVADGTLFNASAYNPALLANNIDFAEVHLGFNASNDIIGIADYVTNSDNINNLQNSVTNVGQYFQDINQGLAAISGGSVNVSLYNQGVTGIQNAINNMQTALNNVSNKTIQVGAGLNIAVKVDDHFGFQAYNTTQAAVQIGRGSITGDFLALTALPTMQGSSNAQVQAAAVSLYSNSQTVLNAFLDPAQQQQLGNAVTTFKNSPGNPSDILTFSNAVSTVLNGVTPITSQQTLFNGIVPVEVIGYSDTVIMGTYCMRPLEDDKGLSIGTNLKAINRRIASIGSYFLSTQNLNQSSDIGDDLKNDAQKTTWRWGLDLGAMYEFSDPKISVGIAATDILHNTATLDTAPTDPLYGMVTDSAPTVIRIGASCKPIRELTVNCDVDDLFSNTSYFQGQGIGNHLDFGFNYDLAGIIQLRGGVTNGNLCGGLGLPLGIQYAYSTDNLTQSYNHYLQFDVAF